MRGRLGIIAGVALAAVAACQAPIGPSSTRQVLAVPDAAEAARAYAAHMRMLGSGLRGPNGLAVDRRGYLYESDWSGNSVTRVAPDGTCTRWAGGFNGPAGLAFEPDGSLLVACYNAHTLERVAPGGGSHHPAVSQGLKRPVWPAVDSHGTIYLADYANNRIARIRHGGPAETFKTLPGVNAIALDPHDGLWVTTWGGRVAHVTPDGTTTDLTAGLATACGIAWSPSYLAVCTYGNERHSTARLLLVDFSGKSYEVATGLNRSSSVLFDPAGNLVVANIGDRSLRVYSLR